jgi:hypothetical protein
MFASFDCLLIKMPFSKLSKSLVPKSGISGVLGLNTQDKNNVYLMQLKDYISKNLITGDNAFLNNI